MSDVPVDFIGRGWAFPLGVDERGRIALTGGTREIEEAIRIILLTRKGERPMRPEFGCEIHDLTFAPGDATTAGLVAYHVEQALAMWEPRIKVTAVDARPDPDRGERMLIEIQYKIKSTLDRRTLVFPFYTIPGE